MNILFVCRYNRFRSRVAEAYFKKINKNKNIKVKSAGIFKGNYPLNNVQEKAAKELGINIKGRPKPISSKLLDWQDVIIAITDDLPKGLFNYGPYKNKVLEWKIKDVETGEGKNIKKNKIIIPRVMKKVEQLNKKLNKK